MTRLLLTTLLLVLTLTGCGRNPEHAHDHGEDAHAEEAPQKGPHGGRLLSEGDFIVELVIYETGVPPEFRAWISAAGRPIDPRQVQLKVELTRLGGAVDAISFTPEGEFLRGSRPVAEPHSFEVVVTAIHAGRTYRWTFASHEGRVTIPAAVAREAGIRTATAGPGVIEETLTLYGVIRPDASRVREVKARFPGVIRSVRRRHDHRLAAGEVLATVESNESLQTYPVTAPIAGLVTQRDAGVGEQAESNVLFEIADFSRVWAEFDVFPRDRSRLKLGQPVQVLAEGGAEAEGRLSYISPLSSRENQSVGARVVLDNDGQRWTPGQFVEGRLAVSQTEVPLAVPLSALQSFRDFTVVFAQFGETYEVRMLELGRRDAERVEVLGGLEPGTAYVTENSYLIKADIEKSGASHDH
jgi:membrane fusion protein, heavy metal efflux system